MPFTDPVSNVSGRNSRASNVSAVTAASRSIRAQPPPTDAFASAAVLGMLKTTTDTGDIGSLSFQHTRQLAMPRATHQKRGHHPKLSGPNHHYAPSQISGVSSSREWESISNNRRGSFTSMQSMPPSLPPAHLAKDPTQRPPVFGNFPGDNRSYSLSSAPPTQQLPRHRSATSLKSQGHEPSAPSQQYRPRPPPPPPMPENRPPYVYPTRLKRPGYRSPSPALSDTAAQVPQPPPAAMGGRRMPMAPGPPPPRSYNSDYAVEHQNDPRRLHGRPPPQALSNAPMMEYSDPLPPAHYPYRNQAAMRSAPGLGMPIPPSGEHYLHPHGPAGVLHARRPPPVQPMHVYAPQPAMSRPPYAGLAYHPRPGYPPYPPSQYVGYRAPPPPPPPPAATPMAHSIFHNAARMARHLPQRTDTPMTDLSPPSSDPPSSSTAPSSSNPPTPMNHTALHLAVDPAFIDPALIDLQESPSEPVMAHHYLRYAEGLEKDVDDTEMEVAHPSVPPSGFVQRVRAMLESKAAAETAVQNELDREKVSPIPPPQDNMALIEYHRRGEQIAHELAADEAPRFTVIEEYEAPVELPASPVRLPELPASPVRQKRPITRELVKAELATSSMDDTTTQAEITENKNIDEVIRVRARQSCDTGKHTTSTADARQVEAGEPSTPAHINDGRNEDSFSEAASSPETVGHSIVDYATRLDITTSSDETQTRDPFMLDADTITLQHQRSKESANKPDEMLVQDKPRREKSQAFTDNPVSSIVTGEEVSRCSAVSPLQNQTLGIDETLRATDEPSQEDTIEEETSAEEPTVPGAFPDDTTSPATPKTSRTYSKSVQLQRSPAFESTGTPSSNRYSLPPDLSTFTESSMNNSTDMITDVAVRFSLPQTTITVSKPHIIEIPPTSSPQHEQALQRFAKPPNNAFGSKSKRGSVTFADDVAPLKINKKLEPSAIAQKPVEPRASIGKSIVRRVSPLQKAADSSRISRESTTDLRFPGPTGINDRFGSRHLPGLKEESIDDMSVSDKHKSDGTSGFQFPLPARIAAVKAMQERRLQESADKAKARRAHRHPSRPLAEARDLPSLNFSRMDLIDKLNEALEVRSSKSMDLIRRREFSGIYCPSPQRPQSTEPLRERYMSFFCKPEDFSTFLDTTTDSEDEGDTQLDLTDVVNVPAVEVQPGTEIEFGDADSRPLSPEDFLDVANQVNRLSIPSVTGLSDRLSEMLPNLRDLQLDSVLANFAEVAEGIRGFGDGVRPETALSTRTSAGFRSLAERAEQIVKNGTHDSTVPIAKLLAAGKELPALAELMIADHGAAVRSVDGKPVCLTGSASAPSELGNNVTRPASIFAHHKSPATEEEVQALLPPEMNPITRSAKRALLVSSSSSRPWNQDENYPWAGTKVDVDLTVPAQAHGRSSIASEILRKRKTKSLELTSTGEPTDTRGIDIGSLYERNPTETLTSEQLIGISLPPAEHHHRVRSVIGSITRKFGLGSRGEATTTRSILTPTDTIGSGSTLPHRAGERYPTSGLTPPAAFNLDEVRSFFSDDSSDKDRNASIRKRLTKLRSKKSLRLDAVHSHSRHSMDENTAYDAGQMSVDRAGAPSSAHTIDGVGMGKTEFRIKRFGEKLRNLMAKGGELIRSLSQRSKAPRGRSNERVREDWLSDSLYSGV